MSYPTLSVLFDHPYIHDRISDDYILLHEKVDSRLVWLTYLLPGLMKSNLLPQLVDDLLETFQILSVIKNSDAYKLLNLLLTYCFNHCTNLNSTLNVITKIKNKNFHLNSWSGLIFKKDLFSSDLYDLPYTRPEKVEMEFIENIISRLIVPALSRLKEITAIIRQGSNDKIGNKELRSICNLLSVVCDSDHSYLEKYRTTIADRFVFDASYGAVISLEPAPLPSYNVPENMLFIANSKKTLLQEIKDAAKDAIEAVQESINNKNSVAHLPVTIKDLEDLFQLIYRSHDIYYGTLFSGQNKSFLDRRFDSFVDSVRHCSNTALNWLLTLDDWHQRRYRCSQRPLSKEVIDIVDIFFSFLRQPHFSLQRKSVHCIYYLSNAFLQLDEYIIHRSLMLFAKDAPPIDEHTHSGILQLLLKIFENKNSFESMSFVYKLVPIFVSLGKSTFVDISSNRNLYSKLFDILVQLMSKFDLSDRAIIPYDFSAIGARLSTPDLDPLPQSFGRSKSEILKARKELYFFCLEHCFSTYLSTSSNEDALPFIKSFLSCSLSSTATWQSLYQMSTILPLHTEIPIPVKFLELFFLILFSPSKVSSFFFRY